MKIIKEVIEKEKKTSGDLSFIITNDEVVKKINIQFLEHHYYTDVISFDYNSADVVNGEIYISIDTVKKNALNYKVSLKQEIVRVMIHGVLHLVGYNDKEKGEKVIIGRMEDKWLSKLAE